MQIMVINPNTDPVMTEVIRTEAAQVKRPETVVEAVNAIGGPMAIETAVDEAMCIPGILTQVRAARDRGVDAVVIACFFDPGLEAARELTDVPVVGVMDASLHLAAQLADRVSILIPSIGVPMVPGHLEVLRSKLGSRFASVRDLELSVPETARNADSVLQHLNFVGRRAMEEDGARAFVFGCAGLGYLAPRLQRELRVPVVGLTAAGVKTAEVLLDLDLTHAPTLAAKRSDSVARIY